MARLCFWLMLCGLILGPDAEAAAGGAGWFRLTLELYGVAQDEVAPAQRFLDEVTVHLPPRLKAAVAREVRVSFAALDGHTEVVPPACPGREDATAAAGQRQVLGEALPGWRGDGAARVRLHRGFLRVLHAGPARAATYPCGHRDLYRLALASLLHELVHLYDAASPLSADSSFRALHRIEPAGLWERRHSRNQLGLRSPDAYEYVSAREALAVHLEYFLLDPEYRCRMPAGYAFLEQRFGYRPFPPASCTINQQLLVDGRSVDLDASRVYEIHYLHASAGATMESRWGHGMFRIILCAPERPRVDAGCLEDVQHHLVLSFAANLNGELDISAWRGLTGGYTSQLFVRPLLEAIVEYTELELRDLISLPLRLSAAEKQRFLWRALEIYWSYSGRYYFLTNNCAEEAAALLHAAVQDGRAAGLRRITPGGLLNALRDSGLTAPTSALAKPSPEEEERAGRLFRSLAAVYAERLRALLPHLPQTAPRRLDKYLERTTARLRRAWFQTLLQPVQRAQAARFFALENLVLLHRAKQLQERLKRFYVAAQREPRYRPLRERVELLMRAVLSGQPWELARPGYGIPLREELRIDTQASALPSTEGLQRVLLDLLRSEFQTDLQELSATYANRKLFQDALFLSLVEAPAGSAP